MQGNRRPLLQAVDTFGQVLATVLMLSMMGVTVVDVVARKFGYSFGASFEVTQLLVALTFYAVLPQATARRAHIVVDLLPQRAEQTFGLVSAILIDLLCAFAIGWTAAMLLRQGQTLDMFHTLLQFTRLPLSPFVTAMGVLAALAALVCLVQAVLRMRALSLHWKSP